MTESIATPVVQKPEISTARRRYALFALALGGFGIGSAEFVSMGLLPGIAQSLLPDTMAVDPEQGIAHAGLMISAYALGVVIGAPTLALLAVTMSRSRMIVLMAGALALGTLLSALMPTFELGLLARFVAGVPHGAYFGLASLLAASLMGPGNQGKGVALAMSGLTVANLAGVPVLTAIGQAAGWRVAYGIIALIFGATVILLVRAVPRQEKPVGRRLIDELRAFRRLQLWVVMGIAAIGFAGAFAVFSYISDIARNVAGAPASFVPWLLAAAGLGMTIGNLLGGWAADRSLFGTLLGTFPVYIGALVAMVLSAHSPTGLILTFFLVNLANAVLIPPMQTWLIRIAGRSEVLGASLNHASFNVANALGAALGGAVIAAGLGFEAPILIALALSVLGMGMVVTALTLLRIRSRRRIAQLESADIAFTSRQRTAA